MTDKGKERVAIAQSALKYWGEITKALIRKMSLHGANSNGEYRLFFINPDLPYNYDAIEIIRRIFKRSMVDLSLSKFRITSTDKYAYIFKAQFLE